MITTERFDRIVKHLDKYGNTIIVPRDFYKDTLENLLQRIEKEGFKISMFYEGNNRNEDSIYHYVIHARREGTNAKPKRKTKPAKAKL